MKIVTAIIFATSMFLFLAVPMPAGAAPRAGNDARNSSGQWLALIDAGESRASWKTAAEYFKSTVSREEWERSLGAVRRTLGRTVSRKLTSVKFTRSIPGAPDGEYVVLQFQTSFAKRTIAVETVTPKLEKDHKWRVCGYYLHLPLGDSSSPPGPGAAISAR